MEPMDLFLSSPSVASAAISYLPHIPFATRAHDVFRPFGSAAPPHADFSCSLVLLRFPRGNGSVVFFEMFFVPVGCCEIVAQHTLAVYPDLPRAFTPTYMTLVALKVAHR